MPTSVVRQDEQFQAPARTVVPIAQEVFGLPRGSGGPVWILDPPPEVRRLFWARFGEKIQPHQGVLVAEGRLLLEAVRDLHEQTLPALEGRAGPAWLFFVDRDPLASWSHPCAYVVMCGDDEALWIDHGWPPSEAIRLVPLPRPRVVR